MRKLLLAISTCLAIATVSGQTSDEILRHVSDKIASLGNYSVAVTLTSGSESVNGSYRVSNDKYIISAGSLTVICNGTTTYEIDANNKEIVIDNSTYDQTVWSNPAKMFSALNTRFAHKSEGTAVVNGEKVYRLRLNDKSKPDESFTLTVNAQTYLPTELLYGSGDSQVRVRFIGFRSTPTIEQSDFVFEAKGYPDYEIIDMR